MSLWWLRALLLSVRARTGPVSLLEEKLLLCILLHLQLDSGDLGEGEEIQLDFIALLSLYFSLLFWSYFDLEMVFV